MHPMGAFRRAALAACCMLSGWSGASRAAVDLGGSVALTRDDVYRGLSLTCGHPAAQADLHASIHGESDQAAFAGVWGSAGLSGTPCGSAREIDAYAGYSLTLTGAVTATLMYTHYAFPGGGYGNPDLWGQRYDYDQLGMSWSIAGRLYLSLAWTPDALHYEIYKGSFMTEPDRSAFTYGIEWRQPLASWLSLAAGAGYDRMADPSGTGYGFWSAGLTHTAGPVELDVAYFRTASRAMHIFGPDSAGGRVSATLLWRF
jgi:uncharacterized protein (TIGR02001 family)